MFRAKNYKDSSAKQDCRSHISHLITHLALSLKKRCLVEECWRLSCFACLVVQVFDVCAEVLRECGKVFRRRSLIECTHAVDILAHPDLVQNEVFTTLFWLLDPVCFCPPQKNNYQLLISFKQLHIGHISIILESWLSTPNLPAAEISFNEHAKMTNTFECKDDVINFSSSKNGVWLLNLLLQKLIEGVK